MEMVIVMFRARQNAIWNSYRVWKNSVPKLREVRGGDRNKDLLSRNYMFEMCPFTATDHQIWSDYGWKSSKTTEVFWQKVVFCTNLKQMFKHTVTDLDTQPMTMQQKLTYVQCGRQLFLLPFVGHLVICFKGRTQNLTSVYIVVKLISTWSTSPGLNSPTFTWHMVQGMATAGKHRGFITSIFGTECVRIIVRSLLLTVTHGKLVHLHWTGTAQGRDDQFSRRSWMMFYSVLRRISPQATVRLIMHSLCTVVLCGTLYASSILSIGRRCGL